jgi:diacylglycerol kinase family enzyme
MFLQWKEGFLAIAIYDNAFLVYNPRAGKFNRDRGRLLQRTIEALEARGHKVTPIATRATVRRRARSS